MTKRISILLKDGIWLRYVTQDGRVEDVRSGRFEKNDNDVKIFDQMDELLLDFPSREVRSWCIFDRSDKPLDNAIDPNDVRALFIASPGAGSADM